MTTLFPLYHIVLTDLLTGKEELIVFLVTDDPQKLQ